MILEEDLFGYRYTKLDENANVINTLFVSLEGGQRTCFIREYAIDKRSKADYYYTTWPLNGDKTRKNMSVLNEDLSMTDEKTIELEEQLLRKAEYYFYELDYRTKANYEVSSTKMLFACNDGKWQLLYITSPKRIAYIKDDLKSDRYRDDFYKNWTHERDDEYKKFTLKYFIKEKKVKYTMPQGGHSGGSSGGYSDKAWVGTGYFDIPLLNDTLKIMQSDLIVEDVSPFPKKRYYLSNGNNEPLSSFHFNITTGSSLNYAILSNSLWRVYVIRKKQK